MNTFLRAVTGRYLNVGCFDRLKARISYLHSLSESDALTLLDEMENLPTDVSQLDPYDYEDDPPTILRFYLLQEIRDEMWNDAE